MQPEIIIPQAVVDIAQGFFVMVAAISLGIPIIRTISRRLERGASTITTLPPDLTHRLERIEQAVEAVAIEVERMAEAQRFTAKLMAEQRPPSGDAAGARALGGETARRPDVGR